MSYSFSARRSTKPDVLKLVAEEMGKVVAAQAVHQADQPAVEASVGAFVALLRDSDQHDICVSVSGSVYQSPSGIENAAVSINVGLAPKNVK